MRALAPRTVSVLCTIVAAVLAATWLLVTVSRWPGIWSQTGQALADSTILVGPWAGVVGSIRGLRYRRSGLRELGLGASRSQFAVLARVVARPALEVVGGAAVAAVAACGWTLLTADYAGLDPWQVASAFGYLMFAVVFGIAIAVAVPHPAAPLVTMLILFVAPYQAVVHAAGGWSRLVPSDQLSMVFLQKSPWLSGLQVVLYGLAAATLAVSMARRRSIAAVIGAGTAGTAVALLAMGNPIVDDPGARRLQCRDGQPRVCLPAALARQTARLHDAMAPAVELTRSLHPGGMLLIDANASDSSVQQIVKSSSATPIRVSLMSHNSSAAAIFDRRLTLSPLTPQVVGAGDCPLFVVPGAAAESDAVPAPVLTLDGEVVSWLLTSLDIRPDPDSYSNVIPPDARSRGLASALAGASPARRTAWLHEHAAQIQACASWDESLP